MSTPSPSPFDPSPLGPSPFGPSPPAGASTPLDDQAGMDSQSLDQLLVQQGVVASAGPAQPAKSSATTTLVQIGALLLQLGLLLALFGLLFGIGLAAWVSVTQKMKKDQTLVNGWEKGLQQAAARKIQAERRLGDIPAAMERKTGQDQKRVHNPDSIEAALNNLKDVRGEVNDAGLEFLLRRKPDQAHRQRVMEGLIEALKRSRGEPALLAHAIERWATPGHAPQLLNAMPPRNAASLQLLQWMIGNPPTEVAAKGLERFYRNPDTRPLAGQLYAKLKLQPPNLWISTPSPGRSTTASSRQKPAGTYYDYLRRELAKEDPRPLAEEKLGEIVRDIAAGRPPDRSFFTKHIEGLAQLPQGHPARKALLPVVLERGAAGRMPITELAALTASWRDQALIDVFVDKKRKSLDKRPWNLLGVLRVAARCRHPRLVEMLAEHADEVHNAGGIRHVGIPMAEAIRRHGGDLCRQAGADSRFGYLIRAGLYYLPEWPNVAVEKIAEAARRGDETICKFLATYPPDPLARSANRRRTIASALGAASAGAEKKTAIATALAHWATPRETRQLARVLQNEALWKNGRVGPYVLASLIRLSPEHGAGAAADLKQLESYKQVKAYDVVDAALAEALEAAQGKTFRLLLAAAKKHGGRQASEALNWRMVSGDAPSNQQDEVKTAAGELANRLTSAAMRTDPFR